MYLSGAVECGNISQKKKVEMLPVFVQVSPLLDRCLRTAFRGVFILADDMAIQFFQETKSDQALI
jgi:hypothetical protein